tara:strand:- start:332 stop:829 length:498 start_codon:yes stop_codon:yes gene_type:complete
MAKKDIQDNVTVADQPYGLRGEAQTVVDDGRPRRYLERPARLGPRTPSILDVRFNYHDVTVMVGSERAVLNLPYPGFSFPIDGRGITIGRSERADLQILDGTVSSMHARLRYQNGILSIEDLSSTNGTYLNGRRITSRTPMRVRDGSQIKIAKRLENTLRLNFRG